MTVRQHSILAAVLTACGGLAVAALFAAPLDFLYAQPPPLPAPTAPPPIPTEPPSIPPTPAPAAPPSSPAADTALRQTVPIPTEPPASEVVPAGQAAPAPPAIHLTPIPQAPPTTPPSSQPPPGSLNPQDPPTPVVALQVRVPASVAAGKELEYRLIVRNLSQAAAHHVRVRCPLPAHAAFVRSVPEPTGQTPALLWDLGTLEANNMRDIRLVVRPDGHGDVKCCARVQFEHGQCVTTQLAKPNLTLQQHGPSLANRNDAVTYRLEVRNTGAAAAEAVVLRATLPDGLEAVGLKNPLTWDLGTLAPGQAVSREYQALARKSGELTAAVTVTAAGGLHAETQSAVLIGEPRLQLDVKGPETALVNRPATVLIAVSNPGTGTANNVVLYSTLPPRATLLRVSDSGRLIGTQVQWQLGPLKASERRTVQLALNSAEGGEVILLATAAADRLDPVRAEMRMPFTAVTGLTADVAVADNPVEVGQPTRYLVTVRNQGSAAASRVGVVCLVPDQMDVATARGPTTFHTEGRRVTFEPLASLPPRSMVCYEVGVLPRDAGDVRFCVELTADQLSAGPVRREQSTTIYGRRSGPQQ